MSYFWKTTSMAMYSSVSTWRHPYDNNSTGPVTRLFLKSTHLSIVLVCWLLALIGIAVLLNPAWVPLIAILLIATWALSRASFAPSLSLLCLSMVSSILHLSHGWRRHCPAVGLFSGAKSINGHKNLASSSASFSLNLYFSTNIRSKGQYRSRLMCFKSPCLSKRSRE